MAQSYTGTNVLEQFALNINGQTVAQTGAQSANAPKNTNPTYSSGGLGYAGHDPLGSGTGLSVWADNLLTYFGLEVADPRFMSYNDYVWVSHPSQTDVFVGDSFWKGVSLGTGSRTWSYLFPSTSVLTNGYPISTWANRDNIARAPAKIGSIPSTNQTTPDALADEYSSNDSNAAPDVIRNGPMVSIGELGHVFDPANANDALTDVAVRTDSGGFTNAYSFGGGRSLRIGAPEYTGALTNYYAAPALAGWNVNGERAISLLDLFTVNSANTNASGTNSIAQSLNNGGALGRININTASTSVLAALLSGIQITSDPTMTNSSGTFISPAALNNVTSMVNQMVANRPYSSLSDLYKITPMFDTNVNYAPNLPILPGQNVSDGNGVTPFTYPVTLNVFNRVHQEAFGKLVQHLTVQSRSYRVFVIGQVLDSNQNPHGSIAMEAGIYLQYNPNSTPPKYVPTIQYLRILK